MSKFPNDHIFHHIPKPVIVCLCYWQTVLDKPCTPRSLKPRHPIDLDIWVDASTSWGIGIVIAHQWAAWKLIPGWKADGMDIGWAKSIALELAILILINRNFVDCTITIHGDNTGVIGAVDRGRSRSIPRNDSIQRITSSMIPNNITIRPIYVPSATNRADPVSRGILGPSSLRATRPLVLPPELFPYIQYV